MGMLGSDGALDTLLEHVATSEWDEGWNYTGMGQFGMSNSALDAVLIAIGKAGNPRALATVLACAETIPADAAFSHYRALAEVCEQLVPLASPDEQAKAQELFNRLLARPDMSGHAQLSVTDTLQATDSDQVNTSVRNNALREIHLARAAYRCGDRSGLGYSSLNAYANDVRGHFAKHARAVI